MRRLGNICIDIRYTDIYKAIYIILIIIGPFVGYLRCNFECNNIYGNDSMHQRFTFHLIVLVLNIVAWIEFRRGSSFGTIFERVLSIGRMLMIICGSSVAFAFFNMESPLYETVWRPLISLMQDGFRVRENGLNEHGFCLYIFACGMLLTAESIFFAKLDFRQSPGLPLFVTIYACALVFCLVSSAIGWRGGLGFPWFGSTFAMIAQLLYALPMLWARK